jgi:hypothetical protein
MRASFGRTDSTSGHGLSIRAVSAQNQNPQPRRHLVQHYRWYSELAGSNNSGFSGPSPPKAVNQVTGHERKMPATR